MRLLPWLLLFAPLTSLGQAVKFRDYKKGAHFRYRLTTESSRNGVPNSKSVSISEHRVVMDSGRLAEEIRWVSKSLISKTDTLNMDSIARLVPAYTISLVPDGKLRLPPLEIPEMTGEITDLHTFYVAVSPALHAQSLGPNRLSFIDSIIRGNFADGKEILTGDDCIEVTQKLMNRESQISVIQTFFRPPVFPCINPILDTIGKPMFERPNNFQMTRKATGDKVNVLWGVEEFIITSTLDNRTGQLLRAEMVNELHLKMRYNSSRDLKTFEAEIPLIIRRVLKLELIK